jgi:thymidine kinase
MSLELIIGPMFAGKSSTILQRVKRSEVIGIKSFIVTSSIDTRYPDLSTSRTPVLDGVKSGNDVECVTTRYNTNTNLVKTHDKETVHAVGLDNIKEMTLFAAFQQAKLIIIEEAQFFEGLYEMVKNLVEVYGRDVIVVGLDGDSDRKPFGEILQLIPLADTITKLTALCKRCGDGTPALFTYSTAKKSTQVCVGDAGTYEALCRKHYLKPV